MTILQSWEYRMKFGISVSVLKNTDIEFSVSVFLSTDTGKYVFGTFFGIFT